MSTIPTPAYALACILLSALGVISIISAPGIQPGFGLSQSTCEFIVTGTGFVFMAMAFAALLMAYVNKSGG